VKCPSRRQGKKIRTSPISRKQKEVERVVPDRPRRKGGGSYHQGVPKKLDEKERPGFGEYWPKKGRAGVVSVEWIEVAVGSRFMVG